MADEAFALSPISARAELPSEADYDAIREAFMETARGRWFLGEYGKRNRNADTSMVLDAVARIEATIAAQKPAPSNELPDALVLIRGLLSDAKASAAQTMSGPDAELALAAVNKATRIIREIAWTLREYGTDARICDMLDAQVNAIETSHQHTIATEKRDAVLATFDLLIRRIGELGGSGDAAPSSDFETRFITVSSPSRRSPCRDGRDGSRRDTPRFETASEPAAEAAVELAAKPDEIDTAAAECNGPRYRTTLDAMAHETPEAPSPSSENSAAAMTTASAEVAPAGIVRTGRRRDGQRRSRGARPRDRTGHGRAGRDRAGNGRAGDRRARPCRVSPRRVRPCRATAARRTGHGRTRVERSNPRLPNPSPSNLTPSRARAGDFHCAGAGNPSRRSARR